MLESLKYSFRNPKNIIWVIYRIKQLRNYKKTTGASEDPSLVNNVDELGLVYQGLTRGRWRSWLTHCATSRKVAGSIPDGIIGIFHCHNPSRRPMAMGSTKTLMEMITKNISGG